MSAKQLPEKTAALLLHPELDTEYLHFEGAEEHPFAARAAGYSRCNAWWLADASVLAYRDGLQASTIARSRTGFDVDTVVVGATQVLVLHDVSALIVAFRGTRADEWQDLFDDLRFGLVRWSAGAVHRGFREALERVWDDLHASWLNAATVDGRSVWFTGHSLGAALATLAASRYASAAGVYTFGSPRVGDKAFAEDFNRRHAGRSFRFVNHTDVVTRVPPPPPRLALLSGYRHVEAQRYIDAKGTITELPEAATPTFIPWEGMRELGGLITGALAGGLPALPDFLVDHTPRRYAVQVWNDFDAHG